MTKGEEQKSDDIDHNELEIHEVEEGAEGPEEEPIDVEDKQFKEEGSINLLIKYY